MQGKRALVFEAPRTGYDISQVYDPITVGELREYLENFKDDVLFILSHDHGYTYGSIDITTDVTTFKEINGEWKGFDWDD